MQSINNQKRKIRKRKKLKKIRKKSLKNLKIKKKSHSGGMNKNDTLTIYKAKFLDHGHEARIFKGITKNDNRNDNFIYDYQDDLPVYRVLNISKKISKN